jgi:hypothetical protein
LPATQADAVLIDESGIRRFRRSKDTCYLVQNKSNMDSEAIGRGIKSLSCRFTKEDLVPIIVACHGP